jgi:hypothetical protein
MRALARIRARARIFSPKKFQYNVNVPGVILLSVQATSI